MTMEVSQKLNSLAEKVGEFIQYWGFKKIHGKVWTHIYLSPVPLDAAALMTRLGMSKSLASITLNDLVKHKVIRCCGKGPKDTQVYDANPEVRDVILEILKQREQKMLNDAGAEQKSLSQVLAAFSDHGLDSNRLASVGRMIAEAQMALSAIIALREINYGKFSLR
jgi:DNA-binding transcriptional regulator GbsR (MarR family)